MTMKETIERLILCAIVIATMTRKIHFGRIKNCDVALRILERSKSRPFRKSTSKIRRKTLRRWSQIINSTDAPTHCLSSSTTVLLYSTILSIALL